MEMTAEEICRSYRQAAKPLTQVKILADLNLTSEEEIKKILASRGIKVKSKKTIGTKPTVWTPEKKKAFESYRAQGLNASRMAPLLGIARESIRQRILSV